MYGMLPLGCGLLLWCYHVWYVTTWVWLIVVVLPCMVCYHLGVAYCSVIMYAEMYEYDRLNAGGMLCTFSSHTNTHSWETDGYAR